MCEQRKLSGCFQIMDMKRSELRGSSGCGEREVGTMLNIGKRSTGEVERTYA